MHQYAVYAEQASQHGYSMAFAAVTVLALIGAAATAWLVRRPPAASRAEGASAA